MGLRNKRRYIVINGSKTMMYGYDKFGELGMILNMPWSRPFLFKCQSAAYNVARNNAGNVFEWHGVVYENSITDNCS